MIIEKSFLFMEELLQNKESSLEELQNNQKMPLSQVMVYIVLKINIRNLHNIVFASPSKSRIRNLQSIGRGLVKVNQKK